MSEEKSFNGGSEHDKSIYFLSKLFLQSPETGEKIFIKSAEPKCGKLEIIAGNDDESWKFSINIEEV